MNAARPPLTRRQIPVKSGLKTPFTSAATPFHWRRGPPTQEDSKDPPMSTPSFGPGIEITGRITPEYAQILTPEAVAFAAKLQRAFGDRRTKLLARRTQRQAEFDGGRLPDFLPETPAIRGGDWCCAPIPPDLLDRRVEITGPVDRKMIVNALNSRAAV